MVAQTTLNGDFSGFTASVSGYTIDTSKGTNGYAMVPTGQTLPSHYRSSTAVRAIEFFIYLVEKPYNDTGATPAWSILTNTSLKDNSTGKLKLITFNNGNPNVAETPIDEAAPKIAYTLALPGQAQVFFHFSEPVYADTAGDPITAADFAGASSISRSRRAGTGPPSCSRPIPPRYRPRPSPSGSTAYSLASALYDAQQAADELRHDSRSGPPISSPPSAACLRRPTIMPTPPPPRAGRRPSPPLPTASRTS